MGLFSTSTPFDDAVEKATNEMNTETDWGLLVSLCDKIKETPDGPRKFVGVIVPKLNHKIPHVSMQALAVLDSCVNNCGKDFRKEVASQSFTDILREFLYNYKNKKVTRKLCYLIRKWAEEFKEDPELSHFVSFYYMLRGDGIEFPVEDEDDAKTSKAKEPVSSDPNVVSSQQEADDIARAIEESLKEEKRKGRGTTQISAVPTSIYPSVLGGSTSTSTSFAGASYASAGGSVSKRKAKALYDFEAAEDNELTFKSGDILTILDDSDPNWWKGQGSHGVGLFPANFVTNDLSADVEPEVVPESKVDESVREPVVKFSDEPEVKEVDQSQPVLEIDPDLIDCTLAALQSTDPETTVSDPPSLLRDEETCVQMGKLIDSKLEDLDRKHLTLAMLNEQILESLKLYDQLMNQPPMPTFSQPQYHPGHSPYGATMHGQAPVMVGSYSAAAYPAQQYMHQGAVPGVPGPAPGPSGAPPAMSGASRDMKVPQTSYEPVYQQPSQPAHAAGYHVTNGHSSTADPAQQQAMMQQQSNSYAMSYGTATQSTAPSTYPGHLPPGAGYGNPAVMSQYDQVTSTSLPHGASPSHYVNNQTLPPTLM